MAPIDAANPSVAPTLVHCIIYVPGVHAHPAISSLDSAAPAYPESCVLQFSSSLIIIPPPPPLSPKKRPSPPSPDHRCRDPDLLPPALQLLARSLRPCDIETRLPVHHAISPPRSATLLASSANMKGLGMNKMLGTIKRRATGRAPALAAHRDRPRTDAPSSLAVTGSVSSSAENPSAPPPPSNESPETAAYTAVVCANCLPPHPCLQTPSVPVGAC